MEVENFDKENIVIPEIKYECESSTVLLYPI